ncbi:MAG: ABC transporter ATP-binding protein [Ignavibacteriales bacterium]|nr:ABC transporter ATP-binding protein [Ignavibacteriales bacterium]MBI3787603.1 ABC transporter ATP-binding protein [Ignavibacteriales bacterium]
MSVIEIKSLTKRFGEITAVNDVSLAINKGEMFALVGPDGSGKTTIIRMLCGITKPTVGTLSVLGFDVQKQPDEVRKRIGYLSQKFSLYGDLTVDENIEFFAEIHGVRNYKTRRDELLEFTRLTAFRTRLAEKLSGGMKQKLALACTLIHTPEVIFLDEPTTGVDPVSRRDFWKVLSSLLKTGITIIMTTPYLDEAERCSRVALMSDGKILMTDAPKNLKSVMKEKIVEVVCSNIRISSSLLKNYDGVKEVQAFGDRLNILIDTEHNMPKVLAHLKKHSIEVTDWRVVPPSLENVFISLLSDQGASKESEVAISHE